MGSTVKYLYLRSRGVDPVDTAYNWKGLNDEEDINLSDYDDGSDDYSSISRVPGPESLETGHTADVSASVSPNTIIIVFLCATSIF